MISESKRPLTRWSIFLLLFAASALCLRAQVVPGEGMDSGLGGGNIIMGTVYAGSGQRITARINVRLSTMTRGDRVSATDDNGNFIFRGLPAGTYTVRIEKERDFEPYSQMVDIIQFRGSPPGTYTLSIRLSPRKGEETKPGVLNAAVANLPDRGKELFTKAQDLLKAGDRPGAVEQLKMLTTEFPSFALGWNELGVAYLKQNELEKADEMFRAALKLEPETFAPNMNRGIALVMMKKYAEAEPVLRTARKLDEQSAVVHYFLGQALANLGQFDEAEKELLTAVASGSEQMKEAHRILAIIYSSRNDKKRMAAELETYLRLAPNAPDAEQLRRVLEQLRSPASQTKDPSQKPNSP